MFRRKKYDLSASTDSYYKYSVGRIFHYAFGERNAFLWLVETYFSIRLITWKFLKMSQDLLPSLPAMSEFLLCFLGAQFWPETTPSSFTHVAPGELLNGREVPLSLVSLIWALCGFEDREWRGALDSVPPSLCFECSMRNSQSGDRKQHSAPSPPLLLLICSTAPAASLLSLQSPASGAFVWAPCF